MHRLVAELHADIASFVNAHIENPRPCKRVKPADEILASVRRSFLKANEFGAIACVPIPCRAKEWSF